MSNPERLFLPVSNPLKYHTIDIINPARNIAITIAVEMLNMLDVWVAAPG
jgi:hypothetical protein